MESCTSAGLPFWWRRSLRARTRAQWLSATRFVQAASPSSWSTTGSQSSRGLMLMRCLVEIVAILFNHKISILFHHSSGCMPLVYHNLAEIFWCQRQTLIHIYMFVCICICAKKALAGSRIFNPGISMTGFYRCETFIEKR